MFVWQAIKANKEKEEAEAAEAARLAEEAAQKGKKGKKGAKGKETSSTSSSSKASTARKSKSPAPSRPISADKAAAQKPSSKGVCASPDSSEFKVQIFFHCRISDSTWT